MPLYLLQENGDKILLEGLTGFVILEAVAVPGPTVFYQGGAGHPVGHRRKRRETEVLFGQIEQSLKEALGLVPPPLADEADAAENPAPAWSAARLEAALEELADLAEGRRALESRVERLRESLEAEARARDDDEFWMLLS